MGIPKDSQVPISECECHRHTPSKWGCDKTQALHGLQPLGGGTTPLLIVYFVPLHRDNIQMLLFLEIPKWESQNWNYYYPKTLNIHILPKSRLF
jgi:hypothetical protein